MQGFRGSNSLRSPLFFFRAAAVSVVRGVTADVVIMQCDGLEGCSASAGGGDREEGRQVLMGRAAPAPPDVGGGGGGRQG